MESAWCYRGCARVFSDAPDANRTVNSQPIPVELETYLKEQSQCAQRTESEAGVDWSPSSIFKLACIHRGPEDARTVNSQSSSRLQLG